MVIILDNEGQEMSRCAPDVAERMVQKGHAFKTDNPRIIKANLGR